MKVLLHMCCAPCAVSVVEDMRKDKIAVEGFWYNPNIHPYKEYMARLDSVKRYSKMEDLKMIYNEEYGLQKFVKEVVNSLENRCPVCYRMRLEETAKVASENGYDAFTTTLLISPYQRHELIIEIAEEMAKKYNVKFYYKDFRELFRPGQTKAREKELYMQKYCGCVFSEEERYNKKKK